VVVSWTVRREASRGALLGMATMVDVEWMGEKWKEGAGRRGRGESQRQEEPVRLFDAASTVSRNRTLLQSTFLSVFIHLSRGPRMPLNVGLRVLTKSRRKSRGRGGRKVDFVEIGVFLLRRRSGKPG
jgi:hypothetical protein